MKKVLTEQEKKEIKKRHELKEKKVRRRQTIRKNGNTKL
jgi:hypothetical protein